MQFYFDKQNKYRDKEITGIKAKQEEIEKYKNFIKV